MHVRGRDARELIRDAARALRSDHASTYEEVRVSDCPNGCKLYAYENNAGPSSATVGPVPAILFTIFHNPSYGCTVPWEDREEDVTVDRTNVIRYPFPNRLGLFCGPWSAVERMSPDERAELFTAPLETWSVEYGTPNRFRIDGDSGYLTPVTA